MQLEDYTPRFNKNNMEKLLSHLEDVKNGTDGPVNFQYNTWFDNEKEYMEVDEVADMIYSGLFEEDKEVNLCGTTACVAGHALICLTPYNLTNIRTSCDVEDIAEEVLGLDSASSFFLFMSNSEDANIDDAIARIKFLLEGGNPTEYPFENETYGEGHSPDMYNGVREALKNRIKYAS